VELLSRLEVLLSAAETSRITAEDRARTAEQLFSKDCVEALFQIPSTGIVYWCLPENTWVKLMFRALQHMKGDDIRIFVVKSIEGLEVRVALKYNSDPMGFNDTIINKVIKTLSELKGKASAIPSQ
jgi:hypothetical protein